MTDVRSDELSEDPRVEALERVAAAAQRAFDTGRILPQLIGRDLYQELKDSLEATS